MSITTEVLVEVPISEKIRSSVNLAPEQKEQFLNLLCYFTPAELEELKSLL